MSYQLSDIVTKVQQRVRDTGYSTAEITNYLNDTQNDVFNEYRLPFMQATQTYTLTPNVADITDGSELPANFVQAIDLSLTSPGIEKTLDYLDFTEVERLYPDPEDLTLHPANIPSVWYFYADTIKVYTAPLSDYTVSLKYYKKPTLLTNDADVPDIPSEFEELLVVGAAYRVLQVKDNYDQAGVFENKYQELLQKLVVKYNVHQVGRPTLVRVNRWTPGTRSF